MIFSVKIRYFIFLEDSNKTCDSSNTSATTASSQPNLENCSSGLTSPQSDSAKAADDPEIGESDSHTPVSVHEEIGKSALIRSRRLFSFFLFFFSFFFKHFQFLKQKFSRFGRISVLFCFLFF